ncbi:D-2-hydroxyacid dehydrogenase [Alteromonas oceanisediminis]|uniref:D-2-hydroxyacid dehydrogenase n=1 Tax=Alteromonas oceanisediminis TaxID=2836180 RepID=UPI001BD94476|nr:D-2-hydroxyacid dehydrogenase [Alteromonas oceanisediminis]MBT0585247.1 D-2-hydroxyacid dehydrogenase [Alteromonas oceanisediminis]
MLEVTILSRDAATYETLFRNWMEQPTSTSAHDQLTLAIATDNPLRIQPNRVQVLLSEPDLALKVLGDCNNLQWLQSMWAGNAPLINHAKHDYILTAAKGIFGAAMREYVFAYLLHFARNLPAFETKSWHRPVFEPLQGKTLALLGAGDIAKALVPIATAFGMQTRALTRSGQANGHYDAVFTPQQRLTFADGADYVVSLLPDTAATQHFIDAEFIGALPSSSVLINAGRGQTVDDTALIHALQHQQIKAAVLDVFAQEPLPPDSPYWQLPNAIVTCHTAAISRPDSVFDVFRENCMRWQRNEPLNYVVDFARGY